MQKKHYIPCWGGAKFPEGVPFFLGKLSGGARFPGVQNIL